MAHPSVDAATFNAAAGALLSMARPASGMVAALTGESLEVGAFDLPPMACTAVRRASGGFPGMGGDGVLAAALVFPRREDVAPERVLHQVCRPLLAWLKSMKVPASYFGRDALCTPDAEVVRMGLTGTAERFLVELRIAHTRGLDHEAMPHPNPRAPGDRRPSRPLTTISRHVSADPQVCLDGLAHTLGERMELPDALPRPTVTGVKTGAVINAPIGAVRATDEGLVVGPFLASVGLTEDIQQRLHRGAELDAAVREALAQPGAFVVGASAEHLVAALLGVDP